ncbi:unnamed protein product, partial [Adineta ricciae]
NIYERLRDDLRLVQNQMFIDAFKEKFKKYVLSIAQYSLNQIQNRENPLVQLLRISSDQQEQNRLVKDLIELAISLVEIDANQVMNDAFYHPSRDTFTYTVLFKNSLQQLPIYEQTIHQLTKQLNQWEEGVLAAHVRIWTNLTRDQLVIVRQVWSLVTQKAKKTYQIDALFNETHRDMQTKLRISNQIVTCLNTYCTEANDQKKYHELVQQWHQRFEIEVIQSINVPPALQKLVPFAEKLNPYVDANAWRAFLQQHTAINGKHIAPSFRTMNNEMWNENEPSSPEASPEQIEVAFVDTTKQQMMNTCLDILDRAVDVLKRFRTKLQHICESVHSLPIFHVINLFADIRQAEHDLTLLMPLLIPEALPSLLSIVSFWKDRTKIQHVCKGCVHLVAKVSATIDSTFLDRVQVVDHDTLGEECVIVYTKYQNEIEKRYQEKVLTLISYYSSSSDLLDFLHLLTLEDVYNLQEAVNDWDETLLNPKSVFDFAVVKNFIDRAYKAMSILDKTSFQLERIVDCFIEVWKDAQFTDLLKCLESASLALSSIKRIHLELTDKEQSKRRRIADILQKSTIYFVHINDQQLTFDINVELPVQQTTTTNDEKKQQNITFADLSELRDRARLLEYSSNVKKQNLSEVDHEREKHKLREFIQFVSIVELILEILRNLYTAGHPSVSEFLKPKKTFSCTNEKYDDLRENCQILENLLKNWEIHLCRMYEKFIGLTYFSSDQFWQIEEYIYNRPSLSHPGYHFLQFIGIDSTSIIQPQCAQQQQSPEDRLANLGRWLSKKQRVDAVEESPKNKKCFLIETTNEGVLRAILSLFDLMTTPSEVQRIFYCTWRTNWVQVRAFIYRCFYSQTLHQIIRPERLSQSIQHRFTDLLRTLMESKPRQYFRIGIITTTPSFEQQLINGLQSMQVLHIYRDHELLNANKFKQILKRSMRPCTLVTSKITGLGKSSLIRQTIRSSGKKYVKFPIYGDFDVDTLAERLRSKYPECQRGAIHFDIGTIENRQQLNEIFYCLLLFGSFQFGQATVAIPAETPIYIELDASPQSTLTEITLFDHVETSIPINQIDWNNLNVNDNRIQVVANYLQAIADKTILKQNINPTSLKILDLATCSRLIQQPFLAGKNQDFITWTQLQIFIGVFYRLFTGFSRCGHFLCEYVPNAQLRMDLVLTLLQSSNQFTSLSVENVRIQQQAIATNEPVTFSDAIVRWDTIQPFTLVFTATDDALFVYKKPDDVPAALKQYFEVYHRSLKKGKQMTINEMFPDYNQLSHAQLFSKLASLSRKYFNKSICPVCFCQYEYTEQRCQQCSTKEILIRPKTFDHDDISIFQLDIAERLQNEYVLTPDNFIKMLLIYLRVQSGIPVLIMGETGCGKTALIQFLCQKILDDQLQVFRMHAGVQANDIIHVMQHCVTQALELAKQNKQMWIFFDEFNTTSNIGLLKEIMCERTLLGTPLPINIVFLGACNPRRKKTKKIMINDDAHIGLRKTRYETQKLLCAGTDRCLLYTVVPIPETMLEYIWDYGYLNEPTEKAYIQTMLKTCRDLSSDATLFDLTVTLLLSSQNHMRDLEDVSSVSLRDVARFCRLYNWFLNSLNQRANENPSKERPLSYSRRASLIALLLC